jgi:hypothetical protein
MEKHAICLWSWNLGPIGQLRKWNMDLHLAGKNRQMQLSKLEEWREKAYHNSKIYKDRTKRWHDKRIKYKEFTPRDKSSDVQFKGKTLWSWKTSEQMGRAIQGD